MWKHYLIVGGLPESVKAYREYPDMPFEAFQAAREVQRDFLETYRADISKHSGKSNAMLIERVWNYAADNWRLRRTVQRESSGSKTYYRAYDPMRDWLLH